MSSKHPDKLHTPPKAEAAKNNEQPSEISTTNKNNTSNSEPSLLTRIQNSATSLIQDTLTRPSAATLSTDLAHILNSGNNKGYAPASASSSTYSGNSRSTDFGSNSSSGGSYKHDDAGTSRITSFRSPRLSNPGGNREGGGVVLDPLEFDAFQNTTGFFHADGEELLTDRAQGKGKGKQQQQQPNYNDVHNDVDHGYHNQYMDLPLEINEYDSTQFNDYEIAWINASRRGTVYRSPTTSTKRLSSSSSSPSVVAEGLLLNPSYPNNPQAERNENDGAEVVTLLSDPAFQPGLSVTWDDDLDYESSTMNEYAFNLRNDDDDPFDADGFPLETALTADEIRMIESFRRRQQHETSQKEKEKKKKITPYSLIPDIDSFLNQHNSNTSHKIDDNNNDSLREEVLTNLIGADQWLQVEEQYYDEVWGYLRPALEAASAELKEKETAKADDENKDGDGPAVKRLKMILRHMSHL